MTPTDVINTAYGQVCQRSYDMREIASIIGDAIAIAFPDDMAGYRQALCQVEELGEFVGAFRRYSKMARRPGSWTELENELADIAITTYVTGYVVGIHLPNPTDINAHPGAMERIVARLARETSNYYTCWHLGHYDRAYAHLHEILVHAFSAAETLIIDLPECISRKLEDILTRGWRNHDA